MIFLFNRSGKEADRLYKLGCRLSKEGRDLEAIEEYEKAIKNKFEFKEAWGNMANSLVRLDRYKEGITCYDMALVFDSKYLFALRNKAACLSKMGQFEEALIFLVGAS